MEIMEVNKRKDLSVSELWNKKKKNFRFGLFDKFAVHNSLSFDCFKIMQIGRILCMSSTSAMWWYLRCFWWENSAKVFFDSLKKDARRSPKAQQFDWFHSYYENEREQCHPLSSFNSNLLPKMNIWMRHCWFNCCCSMHFDPFFSCRLLSQQCVSVYQKKSLLGNLKAIHLASSVL